MCLSVKSTCSDLFYFQNEWHVLIFIINTIQSTELRRMPFSIHKLSIPVMTLYCRGLRAFRMTEKTYLQYAAIFRSLICKNKTPPCVNLYLNDISFYVTTDLVNHICTSFLSVQILLTQWISRYLHLKVNCPM